jgi:hypothetical protein
MSHELCTLKARWRSINNSEMPDDIASQPIEIVRKAVEWSRRGVVPVIPKQSVAVVCETSPDDSIQPWDFHKEH